MKFGGMAERIDFNNLFFQLSYRNFVLVYEDGFSIVIFHEPSRIEIEICYEGDYVTKIICNSIFKEKFLPLTFGQMNAFILGAMINRPDYIIKN